MNKLHLVYAADANYLFPLRVAVSSAIAQASRPQDLVIHVLDCGIPDEEWEPFLASVWSGGEAAFVRHPIDLNRFGGFREWHGSLATYARLCLPDLLPDVPWCVYADGDTLFTDDPFKLESLFDEACAMQGHATSLTTQPEWFARHAFAQDWAHYVCAGFLLLNLSWMRAHDAVRWCLGFLCEHPDAPFPDQDALNILCAGQVGVLPDAWGVFSGAALALTRPGCIHYAGELPWALRFRWYVGYSDAACVWVTCCQSLFGLSRRDCTGIPAGKWLAGRLLSRCIAGLAPLLALLPPVRRRFPNLRARFATRGSRWLLGGRLWRRG